MFSLFRSDCRLVRLPPARSPFVNPELIGDAIAGLVGMLIGDTDSSLETSLLLLCNWVTSRILGGKV